MSVQSNWQRLGAGIFCALVASAGAHEKPGAAPVKAAAVLSPAGEQVAATVTQLRDAIKAGDKALVERVMAESVTIFEQGSAENSRTEYLSHHFTEDVAFAKVVPTTVVSTQVEVDGNTAQLTALATSEGQFKGKPVKNASVETYVLRLRDGAWRVEHIHWPSRKR